LSGLNSHAATAQRSNKPPGEEIAQTLSMVTGVAISPLLGVGAVGAWQYFKATTPEQKARLHWYANPYFWIPALFLVTLCFIKDTAGTALPSALKKPLDIADTIESKISGLVATGAFVPLAVSIFENQSNDGAALSAAGFAAIDLSSVYNALMIPISMFIFFVVFLASNAINILILLSPFTIVDAALKAARTTILASVVITAWANPWVGAVWAGLVILLAYCTAGWSFRLSHFGILFLWDFLTLRHKRFVPEAASNKVFLERKIEKAPARTYGRLESDEHGNLVLSYRPWLILPRRKLTLPVGRYAVGRGLIYSEILRIEPGGTSAAILLPPRYLGHEQQLTTLYNLEEIRDVGILAAFAWLKTMFGGRAVTAQN
jgi:hypothetical protein